MKTYSASDARKDLPERKNSDSKTRGGKCLIIAGSPGMWGAAMLSGKAAARSGAGYVYIFHQEHSPFAKDAPDFLMQNKLSKKEIENFKAIAIGPGLPTNKATLNKIKALIKYKAKHVVVDASALNAIAKSKTKLKLPSSWVMTPHEGELGRLINKSGDKIRAAREQSIKQAQETFGCVIVLKGHGTLVADEDGVTKVDSGNPALAKAGTGDVLTGIITAFLAQGLQPQEAACLGVYVHGLTADRWVSEGKDQLSLMASDIIEELPTTLAKLRNVRTKKKTVRKPSRKKR